MVTFDFYSPNIHKGNLPIRVLGQNIISWFEKIGPNILEQMRYEVEVNELKPGIGYLIDDKPIQEIPYLSKERQFVVYESFCQYLWNICYAVYISFVEGVEKPSLLKQQNLTVVLNESAICQGIVSFAIGLRLFKMRDDRLYYMMPNPERYDKENQFYIEKANSIYIAAMTWILYHEFAHQYYDHISYEPTADQSKAEETLADEFATDNLLQSNYEELRLVLKTGIICGLGAIVLSSEKLDGGDQHPDSDVRFEKGILSLNLAPEDDLWGLAATFLHLWLVKNRHEFMIENVVDTPMELFNSALKQARSAKDRAGNDS